MLVPDRGRVSFSETDVTSPVGLIGTNDAYDCTLYHDAAGGGKGVLVVKLDIQLLFKDGDTPELQWSHGERTAFIRDYGTVVPQAWSDKHRITTTSRVPAIYDVGVLFEVNLITQGVSVSEHWEIAVRKTSSFTTSWVNTALGFSRHDSLDFQEKWQGTIGNIPGCTGAANVCAIQQRAAVHEFGHMLGLRDEYPSANANPHWVGQTESVMHSGEVIKARHYAIFAHWLTAQCEVLSRLSRETIEWKVGGTTTMSNANL